MNKQVTITIDNQKITAPEGANLLQVAKDNQIAIPPPLLSQKAYAHRGLQTLHRQD